MKNESRVVELLSESLKRQDQMVDEIRGMKGEIRGIKEEIHDMNQKIEDNHQENQAGNERVISAVNTLTDIVQPGW